MSGSLETGKVVPDLRQSRIRKELKSEICLEVYEELRGVDNYIARQ